MEFLYGGQGDGNVRYRGEYLSTGILPLLKLLSLTVFGVILVNPKMKLVLRAAFKVLSKLVFALFLPCTVFVQLGKTITSENFLLWYVVIKHSVDGTPREDDFEIKFDKLSPSMESGKKEVLVKNFYVSIDPYQLNRMKNCSSSQGAINFSSPVIPGQPIDAYGVGKVIASGNPEFREGDFVAGLLTWGEYTVVGEGGMLNKLDTMGFPLSYHVGVLAFSGLTAYGGFFDVCKPKKGEKVFISAASGSVGSLVGQYAKLLGCYVVGCAGSQNKVDLLKGKLGFDDAFNYKEETDFKSVLQRYFPDGIDIYFDNVGGEMLEAAIANMKVFGRVAVCGVISEYTGKNNKRAAPDMVNVVYKRIRIQGFLAADYMKLFEDFLLETTEYLRAGKMQALEDISYGLESIPSAFIGLFHGGNVGKKMVQLTTTCDV